MIRCTQCGTKNKDDSRYCEDCGATLKYDKPVQMYDRDEDDGSVVLVDHESGGVEVPVIRPSRTGVRTIPSVQYGTGGNTKQGAQGLAVVAFVMSLVALVMCYGFLSFVPFILGIVAMTKYRNEDGSVNRMALIAVILSSVGMFISFLVIVASIFGNSSK